MSEICFFDILCLEADNDNNNDNSNDNMHLRQEEWLRKHQLRTRAHALIILLVLTLNRGPSSTISVANFFRTKWFNCMLHLSKIIIFRSYSLTLHLYHLCGTSSIGGKNKKNWLCVSHRNKGQPRGRAIRISLRCEKNQIQPDLLVAVVARTALTSGKPVRPTPQKYVIARKSDNCQCYLRTLANIEVQAALAFCRLF